MSAPHINCRLFAIFLSKNCQGWWKFDVILLVFETRCNVNLIEAGGLIFYLSVSILFYAGTFLKSRWLRVKFDAFLGKISYDDDSLKIGTFLKL